MEANKEKQAEEMEKKMGAKERAEKVTKEVRTTQQQAQRVMGSMQQVVKAVAVIRAQLKLTTKDGDDIPSVAQDQKVLEQLQKKMFDLKSQLGDLRVALTQENVRDLEREHPEWNAEQVRQAAEAMTEEWVRRLGLEG